MVNSGHPLWKLRSELFDHRAVMSLEFSRYVYREFGVTEYRKTFQISADKVQDGWLSTQLNSLESEEELALHSRVNLKGATLHIPMIDFVNIGPWQEIHTRLQHISKRLGRNLWLYSTGRSLHGYYFVLVDEPSWYRFLGELLLCNSRGRSSSEIVDSRWVGHSLVQGFSALRWSQNTSRHSSLPYLVNTENTINDALRK
jgi:hypothetical protein